MPHLVPKQIIELPYVDRVPNPSERPDQRRIEWIKNGDCLGAADHAADNSGELNRGPVQVQKNAVTLIENDKIIEESLAEIIERVNSHDDALGSIGDDNLANKVEALELIVEPMDEKITANTQSIFLLSELTKSTRDKVGTKDVLDINDRSVFSDLLWVKEEIGNWANKDVNDNDDVTKPVPSGLKARIVAHGLSISANERRIRALENDWVQSDVGALTSEVHDIRSELGRVVDAPVGGVYPWIIASSLNQVKVDAEIQSLKDIVGGQGGQTLDERIRANTNDITNNKTAQDDIDRRLGNLTAAVGDGTTQMSLTYKVNQTEVKVATMNRVLGETEDEGMQKKVSDIVNEMGDDATDNTIKGRLATNETSLREIKRDIATIDTKIGDNTVGSETGIYRRIMNLESDVESSGTGIKDRITVVEGEVKSKIDDAPMDGKKYIRTNKTWEEVVELPLRIHGGYRVINNDTVTSVTTSGAMAAFDSTKVSTLALNSAQITNEVGKLKFNIPAAGHVVNAVLEFRVNTTVVQPTAFEVVNKAGVSMFMRTVMTDEWSTGKNAVLRMQLPVQLDAMDELSIKISAAAAADVIVADGMFYVFSI